MDDVDLARELIILKAKDLGMDDESLNELDEVVCNILGIKDADPFIWPSQHGIPKYVLFFLASSSQQGFLSLQHVFYGLRSMVVQIL